MKLRNLREKDNILIIDREVGPIIEEIVLIIEAVILIGEVDHTIESITRIEDIIIINSFLF